MLALNMQAGAKRCLEAENAVQQLTPKKPRGQSEPPEQPSAATDQAAVCLQGRPDVAHLCPDSSLQQTSDHQEQHDQLLRKEAAWHSRADQPESSEANSASRQIFHESDGAAANMDSIAKPDTHRNPRWAATSGSAPSHAAQGSDDEPAGCADCTAQQGLAVSAAAVTAAPSWTPYWQPFAGLTAAAEASPPGDNPRAGPGDASMSKASPLASLGMTEPDGDCVPATPLSAAAPSRKDGGKPAEASLLKSTLQRVAFAARTGPAAALAAAMSAQSLRPPAGGPITGHGLLSSAAASLPPIPPSPAGTSTALHRPGGLMSPTVHSSVKETPLPGQHPAGAQWGQRSPDQKPQPLSMQPSPAYPSNIAKHSISPADAIQPKAGTEGAAGDWSKAHLQVVRTRGNGDRTAGHLASDPAGALPLSASLLLPPLASPAGFRPMADSLPAGSSGLAPLGPLIHGQLEQRSPRGPLQQQRPAFLLSTDISTVEIRTKTAMVAPGEPGLVPMPESGVIPGSLALRPGQGHVAASPAADQRFVTSPGIFAEDQAGSATPDAFAALLQDMTGMTAAPSAGPAQPSLMVPEACMRQPAGVQPAAQQQRPEQLPRWTPGPDLLQDPWPLRSPMAPPQRIPSPVRQGLADQHAFHPVHPRQGVQPAHACVHARPMTQHGHQAAYLQLAAWQAKTAHQPRWQQPLQPPAVRQLPQQQLHQHQLQPAALMGQPSEQAALPNALCTVQQVPGQLPQHASILLPQQRPSEGTLSYSIPAALTYQRACSIDHQHMPVGGLAASNVLPSASSACDAGGLPSLFGGQLAGPHGSVAPSAAVSRLVPAGLILPLNI